MSYAKRKRHCPSCDASTEQTAGVEMGRHYWECGCCLSKLPRRPRKVMKSDPVLDRLFEELSKSEDI